MECIQIKLIMLAQMFLNSIKKHPTRKCIDRHTYNDVYQLVKKYNWLLSTYHVGKNDRVCWDAKKSAHWPAIMVATWLRGAVFVPFSHDNPNLNEHIVKTVKPKAVLKECLIENMIRDPPGLPTETENCVENPSTILFTSGTTNHPKGVVLSHKNIMTNLEQISNRIGDDITHLDSSFSILPWHHCYGLVCELMFLLKKGASIRVPSSKTPANIMKEIKWESPTLFYTVPKVLENIYKNDIPHIPSRFKRNLIFGRNIRRISVGGAFCHSKLVSFMTEQYDIPTIQGYGMTETSPMISLNSVCQNRINSVGRPVKGMNIDFSYENNEILVRGENVMMGYLKFATKENQLILEEKDDLFHTGDKGYMDKDGYLYINGRTKTEYKLSNGKYVNPIYIEKLLCMSPWIDQAVVFGDGMPHNKVIIHSPKGKRDEMMRHIEELLEGRVQRYEIPNDIVFVEEAFSTKNGLLTQKLEPNRNKILKLYA